MSSIVISDDGEHANQTTTVRRSLEMNGLHTIRKADSFRLLVGETGPLILVQVVYGPGEEFGVEEVQRSRRVPLGRHVGLGEMAM